MVDNVEVMMEGSVLERYNNLKRQWESCCQAREKAKARLEGEDLSSREREKVQLYVDKITEKIGQLSGEMQSIFDRL